MVELRHNLIQHCAEAGSYIDRQIIMGRYGADFPFLEILISDTSEAQALSELAAYQSQLTYTHPEYRNALAFEILSPMVRELINSEAFIRELQAIAFTQPYWARDFYGLYRPLSLYMFLTGHYGVYPDLRSRAVAPHQVVQTAAESVSGFMDMVKRREVFHVPTRSQVLDCDNRIAHVVQRLRRFDT